MIQIIRAKLLKVLTVLVVSVLSIAISPVKISAAISFSIANPIVNADDEIEVEATISGLTSANNCSATGCYLQAELQSAGGNFGYTLNNSGEFVDYFSKPTSTDELKSKLFNFVPKEGYWSGKLTAKNNPENKNYYGPGLYLLVFRRFSGNSLSPTAGDSNSLAVNLAASLPEPVYTDTPTPASTPTPTPTAFTLKTSPPSFTPTPKPTKSPTINPKTTTPSSASKSAETILGIKSTKSADPTPTEDLKNQAAKFPILPVILVLVGVFFITIPVFSIIKSAKKDSEIS